MEDNRELKKESSDSLYIQQMEFKEEDGKSWISFFIYRFRIVLMLIAVLCVWGLTSLAALPLEADPEVEIPVGFVSIPLPGASPADVEELVIKKVEPALANLSGVNVINATALNSLASFNIEFNANEDIKDAIRRLRDEVETVKSELPDDAMDPIVRQVELTDFPIWTIIVTGPYDNFTLRDYAEKVQDELANLPGTSKVTLSGGDKEEVRVSFDPEKLQKYNLSADQINGTIRSSNIALPLGTMEISNFNYAVRVERKFSGAAELRQLPVAYTNGQIIRLKDVADVVEMAEERSAFSSLSIGGSELNNAITLNVTKKTGYSIIKLIDQGKVRIEELKESELPSDLNIASTLDQSIQIREQITELMQSGGLTVFLVVLVLFLFVGFKEAFVAGLAIPIVFTASFGVMNIFGVSLNYLSLFSLILSLGMLVDNAIVVLQASKQYIRTGKFTPEEAVLLVFKDFKFILVTTTLTTVWAFLPLLLSTGIVGQFIRSIPITVSATLISSLFVAFFINHPLVVALERIRITRGHLKLVFAGLFFAIIATLLSFLSPGSEPIKLAILLILGSVLFSLYFYYRAKLKVKLMENEELLIQEAACPEKIKLKLQKKYLETDGKKSFGKRLYTGILHLDVILPTYEKVMRKLFSSKFLSALVLIAVIIAFFGSISLPATGVLIPEFLPQADFEYMYINVEGPPGLITERTKEVSLEVADKLMEEKAIENFSVVIGNSGVNFASFSAAGNNNSNRAQFAILLYNIKERAEKERKDEPTMSYELAQQIRKKIEPIKGAKIEVVEVSGGPPTGGDFEAVLSGEDLKELERLANKYKDILAEIPGTVNEATSISLNPGEFTFYLDYDQMTMRGLNVAQVAGTLRTALSGSEVTKIFGEGDDVKVIADFREDKIPTINALQNLTLSNGRGQLFRMRDIADVKLGSSLTSISRRDQTRILGLSADVEDPRLPAEVLADFQKRLEEDPLPNGYEFSFGGANESTEESILSIFNAMGVAIMLIIVTLVIQFNSFRKTFIVLVTIPLAATGVFYGLLAVGYNLSFPVLIGVLALFGIVINNAIILVEKISQNFAVGIPFTDAIIDASKMRLEAIFLTSICTIIGMLPIALTSDIWGGLGVSLIFGLSASMFLTLLVIPILYFLMMEKTSIREARVMELKRIRNGLS